MLQTGNFSVIFLSKRSRNRIKDRRREKREGKVRGTSGSLLKSIWGCMT